MPLHPQAQTMLRRRSTRWAVPARPTSELQPSARPAARCSPRCGERRAGAGRHAVEDRRPGRRRSRCACYRPSADGRPAGRRLLPRRRLGDRQPRRATTAIAAPARERAPTRSSCRSTTGSRPSTRSPRRSTTAGRAAVGRPSTRASSAATRTRIAVAATARAATSPRSCALLRTRRGGPALALQVLVYPVDRLRVRPRRRTSRTARATCSTPSRCGGSTTATRAAAPIATDWRISPLRAPDLAGVAPALVHHRGVRPAARRGRGVRARARATRASPVETHALRRHDPRVLRLVRRVRREPATRCDDVGDRAAARVRYPRRLTWQSSTSPASSPTSRTTRSSTASTCTTSATSSRATRCARPGRSTSTPRRAARARSTSTSRSRSTRACCSASRTR